MSARAQEFIIVDQKGRATLPEAVRTALNLLGGDIVLLERTPRGTYELIPASLVPNDQLWFHHPAMQERVAAAEDGLAAGRASRTRTVEEAQALLDGLKTPAPPTRPRRRRTPPRG